MQIYANYRIIFILGKIYKYIGDEFLLATEFTDVKYT